MLMNLTWKNKTVIYILLIVSIVVLVMHFLPTFFPIDISNYLTIVSFLFLAISAILLYFQIRTGLSFNKRKAAFDFITINIPNELIPLYRELIQIINIETVSEMFASHTIKEILESKTYTDEQKRKFKKTTLSILNFYERMAIGIYKQVLENDICYDDIGNNIIKFYPWIKHFIDNLQTAHN